MFEELILKEMSADDNTSLSKYPTRKKLTAAISKK